MLPAMTDHDGPDEDLARIAGEIGLPLSRLIGLSKSGYVTRHPQHAVVFNATIADGKGNRLWWGDLDLTIDEDRLVTFAQRAGLDLCVYFEGDSRRGFVRAIDRTNAIAVVHPDGSVELGTRADIFRTPFGRVIRRPQRPADGSGDAIEESDHAAG
jgi:hypothetical protein